jgi:hypothetical protein
MHRSSESVAALASALAKAQAELVNPEKSLTATIWSGRPGEGERSFRYAPLLKRPRHRAQDAWAARDRDGTDHGDRQGDRRGQFVDHARSRLRRRQGPQTGPFFPLTNRLHCEIGYWARSLGWDRVRVRPNGHRELLLPRIGSAQEMRSCWRQRLKQGFPNSYHPKALRSRKSLRLKALTLVVTRLARSMNVGLIKQASIRACSRWRHRAAIATGPTFAL